MPSPLPVKPSGCVSMQTIRRDPCSPVGGIAGRDAAIFRSLARLITKRLNRWRKVHGLPPVSAQAGDNAIQEDFRFGNHDLEAWSILYYRYIRVDLDLSVEKLEDLTGQDKHTIHRR